MIDQQSAAVIGQTDREEAGAAKSPRLSVLHRDLLPSQCWISQA
jgi:hypothetical protein